MWDDKEDPIMHDEILEGNGHLCRLSADLKAWSHTFVLHNAVALGPWCEWNYYSYDPTVMFIYMEDLKFVHRFLAMKDYYWARWKFYLSLGQKI